MKATVIKVNIPLDSQLLKGGKTYEYSDSYQTIYTDKNNIISSTDIAKAFFSSAPKWSEKLFDLRNKIVSIFGLKTPKEHINREEQLKNFACEVESNLDL